MNVRSLSKNFDSFQQFIQSLKDKPHIILITETWLDNDPPNSYALDNYSFEATSKTGFRGKGAAIYIHSSLVYLRRSDLESNIEQFQSVFIEINNIQNRNILLGTVYRSPSFPTIEFTNYLEQILDKINHEHKLCLLGGDFNIDILKHDSDKGCSSFINLLSSLGFFPCISLPTRITSHSATLIDNFYCNDPSFVMLPAVIINDISDHLPISININVNIASHKKPFANHRYTFDFRNIERLRHSVSAKLADFHLISNAESACSVLINTLEEEIIHNSIKKVNRRSVPIQPWISYGLLACINKKNNLHKKFVHSPTELNHTAFKAYRNTLTSLIRTAKAQYYKRKLEEVKHDSKKLWQLLLSIIRKNKPNDDLPRHFVVDGMHINQPDIISDKFNSFLCNIATNLEAAIPHSATDPLSYIQNKTQSHQFCFYPTNQNTVSDIIRNLNNCGAGADGISTKILKMICPDIIPHLTHLFNLCLSQGTFPSIFKKAVIVPIFKSGDRFIFNNYRPIAILPTISKILEKIVYLQLSSYLVEEELLLPNQFGFRKHHSTYMPISLLYDHVTNEIKNKQFCAALYLDLSKAFDTVNPNILLKKLYLYGVRDKCLDFFRSYLAGRSQVLKYNSYISTSAKPITLGVPQGSILGPLLFLLYINDIHKSSTIPQFLLYADDTALLYSAPTLTELQSTINASLPDIATWLNSNRLTLKVKKNQLINSFL